jgi:hypothetical protein
MSEVFHAKTKFIDIHDGEELIVVLNEQEAWEYGINSMDKVSVFTKGRKWFSMQIWVIN